MYQVKEIELHMRAIESDLDKFYRKGNISAADRALKALKQVKNLTLEIRADVLAKKKE